MNKDFDIEKVREVFSKFMHNINWYYNRGGMMPYDWNTYGHPYLADLIKLLKMDWDGSLKSKDKKGSWRIMKNLPKKGEE